MKNMIKHRSNLAKSLKLVMMIGMSMSLCFRGSDQVLVRDTS
jgi:hypothetical protein